MCKKLISFVCVLALASTSYGIPLGDFGGGDDGRGDWTCEWRAPWGVTNSSSTIGATLGGTSLKAVGTGGWWTGQIGGYNLTDDQRALVASRTVNAITIDMTRFSDDWTSGWWIAKSRLMPVVNMKLTNEDGDIYPACIDPMIGGTWYPMYMDGRSDPENGYPDPVVGGPEGMPVTEFFSLDPVFTILDAYAASGYTLTGMDISLMVCNDGYTGNVTYYLDNAQLIPEPTTIALLGLGGLALLRRKR
jgi:hypothetical protein